MLVGRGTDTALIEIDYIFGAVPTVDVVEVARVIRGQRQGRTTVSGAAHRRSRRREAR